jgi:hypothetical protein
MNIPKPIIKYNGGNPVALCNRCFCMMCFVTIKETDKGDEYVIIDKRGILDTYYTSANIGDNPPSFCDKCQNLLFGYNLN